MAFIFHHLDKILYSKQLHKRCTMELKIKCDIANSDATPPYRYLFAYCISNPLKER